MLFIYLKLHVLFCCSTHLSLHHGVNKDCSDHSPFLHFFNFLSFLSIKSHKRNIIFAIIHYLPINKSVMQIINHINYF